MITIDHNILDNLFDYIPEDLRHHQMVVVTDETVGSLYAEKVLHQLPGAKIFTIPPGEQSKTRESKANIESFLIAHECGRDTCLLALGGGVVGDLTGFVAATYMRGIPYIQLPTTLLAMVDSSVGGKTGINTPEGKNLIGAFWEPRAVIAELNCLNTLPETELQNGWFEALKIFLITDNRALQQCNQINLSLIQHAVEHKSNIVLQDFKEQGIRSVLNFGHTIGHALETITDYQLPHGYAVAYGMLFEAKISQQKGILPSNALNTIQKLLLSYGIDGQSFSQYSIDSLISAAALDKKNKQSVIRVVLLKNMGEIFVENNQYTHPVDATELRKVYHCLTTGGSNGR